MKLKRKNGISKRKHKESLKNKRNLRKKIILEFSNRKKRSKSKKFFKKQLKKISVSY